MPAKPEKSTKKTEPEKKKKQIKLALSAQPEDFARVQVLIDWLRAQGMTTANQTAAVMAALHSVQLDERLLKSFVERQNRDKRRLK